MKEKTIFCANDQTETTHAISRSSFSKEIIAICEECGRILKFPPDVTAIELNNLIAEHKTDNEGQQVIKPSEIGPPDVYVSPSNSKHEQQSQVINAVDPHIVIAKEIESEQQDAAQSPEDMQVNIAATEGIGPRAQDNLTPQEQIIFDQIKGL